MSVRELEAVLPYVIAAQKVAQAYRAFADTPAGSLRKSPVYRLAVEFEVAKANLVMTQRSLDRIIGPFAATAHLRATLESMSKPVAIAEWAKSVDRLTSAYSAFASQPALVAATPSWTREAPPLHAYTATRAAGAIIGVEREVLAAEVEPEAERALAQARIHYYSSYPYSRANASS